MSTNIQAPDYTAPPKPPLSVRLDKFKQFFIYEIRRSWKTRTAIMMIFSITVSMLWWVYAVRTPYIIEQQQSQLTPEVFHANIKALEQELANLKNDANTTAQELLEQPDSQANTTSHVPLEEAVSDISEQRIVNDYAGISELLERMTSSAHEHHLTLAYQLEPPTSSNLIYSNDIMKIQTHIQLIPDPTMQATQAWNHLMRQIHYMLIEERKFTLQSIHISTNHHQINQVQLQLQMLVALDDMPIEVKP